MLCFNLDALLVGGYVNLFGLFFMASFCVETVFWLQYQVHCTACICQSRICQHEQDPVLLKTFVLKEQ